MLGSSRLISLAAPIALANLGIMLMGVVDLLAVGHLGAEATASVGLGNSVNGWFFVFGIGLLSAIDFFAGRSIGVGRPHEAIATWGTAVALSLGLGVLSLLALLTFPALLRWMEIPEEVARLTLPFLIPMNSSLIAVWVYNSSRQVLQAFGNTRVVLLVLVASNLFNLLGNLFFVSGQFGWKSYGVWGSGWVTFSSRVFMALSMTMALRKMIRRLPRSASGERVRLRDGLRGVRLASLREYLRVGLPASFQMGLEVGVFSLSSVLAARLGAVTGAAHQIALNLASMTFMVPLGIGSAGTVRVAHAWGAADLAQLRSEGWGAVRLSTLFMSLTCGVFLVFPKPLASFFTDDPEVLRLSVSALRLAGIFQLFDGLQVTFTGVLRGLGNTKDSAVANLLGHWGVGLPTALFLIEPWGIVGIWSGLALGLAMVSLGLWIRWVQALGRLKI